MIMSEYSMVGLHLLLIIMSAKLLSVEADEYACPKDLVEATKYKLSLPHPTCGKFYVCKLGRMRERDCPFGLLFNSKEEVCDYPPNAQEECEEKEALRSPFSKSSKHHQKGILLETSKRQRNRRTYLINDVYYDVETSSADSYVSEISSVSTEADSSSSWSVSSKQKRRKKKSRRHKTTRKPQYTTTIATTASPDTTATTTDNSTTITPDDTTTTPGNTTSTTPDNTTTTTTTTDNTKTTTPGNTTTTTPDNTTTTTTDDTTSITPDQTTKTTSDQTSSTNPDDTTATSSPKPEQIPPNIKLERTKKSKVTKRPRIHPLDAFINKETTPEDEQYDFGDELVSNEDTSEGHSIEVMLMKNGCPSDPTVYSVLPQPGNCAMFIYCFIGKKQEKQCPEGLRFNPRQQVCDWPKNVKCETKSLP